MYTRDTSSYPLSQIQCRISKMVGKSSRIRVTKSVTVSVTVLILLTSILFAIKERALLLTPTSYLPYYCIMTGHEVQVSHFSFPV